MTHNVRNRNTTPNFKYILLPILLLYLHILSKYVTLNLCRKKNNKLVPIILDRLQLLYTQFTKDIERDKIVKPFSNLEKYTETKFDDTSSLYQSKRINF